MVAWKKVWFLFFATNCTSKIKILFCVFPWNIQKFIFKGSSCLEPCRVRASLCDFVSSKMENCRLLLLFRHLDCLLPPHMYICVQIWLSLFQNNFLSLAKIIKFIKNISLAKIRLPSHYSRKYKAESRKLWE